MQQHEEQEQIAIFRWATMQEGQYPVLRYMYHIPNGGHRNKVTAGRLKAAGVKRGVPDICLPFPLGGYAGLYIELKAGKNKPTTQRCVMGTKKPYPQLWTISEEIQMIKIYKDPSGRYWIEGMCDSIRSTCGELCEDGCSVFATMQDIGMDNENRHGCEPNGVVRIAEG